MIVTTAVPRYCSTHCQAMIRRMSADRRAKVINRDDISIMTSHLLTHIIVSHDGSLHADALSLCPLLYR